MSGTSATSNPFLADITAKGVSDMFRDVLAAHAPVNCGMYAAWRAATDLGYTNRMELYSFMILGDSYHKMNHLSKYTMESAMDIHGPFSPDAVDIQTSMNVLGCKVLGLMVGPDNSRHVVYIKGIEGGECTVEDNCHTGDLKVKVSDLKSVCYIELPGGCQPSPIRLRAEEQRELDRLIDDFMKGEFRTDQFYRREIVSNQVGAINRVFYRGAHPTAEKVSAKDSSDLTSDAIMQIFTFIRAKENRFTIFETFQRGVAALADPGLLGQIQKIQLPQSKTEISLEEQGNDEIRYFAEVGKLFRPRIEELKRKQGLADDWKMDLAFDLFSEVPKFRANPEVARFAAGRALVFMFALLSEIGADPVKVLDRGKARLIKEKVYNKQQVTNFFHDYSSVPGYIATGYTLNEGIVTGPVVAYNKDHPEQTKIEDRCILVTSTGDTKLQDYLSAHGGKVAGYVTSAAQNAHASIIVREDLKLPGLASVSEQGIKQLESLEGKIVTVVVDHHEGYIKLRGEGMQKTWRLVREAWQRGREKASAEPPRE